MNEQRASSKTPILENESATPAANRRPTGRTHCSRNRAPSARTLYTEPVAGGPARQ